MPKAEKSNKILLVDDEPAIVTALEFLLEQEGFEVYKAYDGLQALDMMKAIHPSIVVLDVMMPGMDGFEVAKTIRTLPAFEDVRIIFLTAKGTEGDKWAGYRSGGEVYITKPFDNDHFLQVVNEVYSFG